MSFAGEAAAASQIDEAIRKKATHLDLSYLELTSLPDTPGDLTNLTAIHLGGNRLTVLPDWLGQLTKPHMAEPWRESADGTAGLAGPAHETSQWLEPRRESADGTAGLAGPAHETSPTPAPRRESAHSELPDWLGQLTNLTILGLGGNRLSELPDSMGQLTNLTWIHLGGNPLRMLPDSLRQLTNLTWLSIGSSQLRVLPNWLAQPQPQDASALP